MPRIFVTGMGIISAIGNSVSENRTALSEEKCGIGPLGAFPSAYAGKLPCGEVRLSSDFLRSKLNVSESGVTRTTLLALHAFNECVDNADLNPDLLSAPDTAFVNATTVGGMCLTDELYHDANSTDEGSPYLPSYDCGSIALMIGQRYKMKGIINTINTACSSSANAIMYGARLIRHGYAKRAIVGGTDSLAKYTINGFNALHILSRQICAPFDKNRNGLNLGEGSAFLVLEEESEVSGKHVYAELVGYGNANDAFHPSSISDAGEGPFLAMSKALHTANLEPGQINYINAHGTGTENNDETESRAMIRLFNAPPPFSSTKSFTGHTLGAAGAVEAAYTVMNLKYQEAYPSLHFTEPIESTGLKPVTTYSKMKMSYAMSNAFGFGGNCTSLIFSKA
ncbi:MAG: beta-ketoacyl-[acyl-carrier-protein] synthase family protein [Bacteroidetes bacterium]|nr:MAG: beta-ketoacyl-[acyl-carrier-protein] synthase family protein [Bacteroidota bacterium]